MIKYVNFLAQQLEPIYHDADHQQQIVWMMLKALTNKSQAQLLQSSYQLNKDEEEMLNKWIFTHVQTNKPLAYIIGSVPFGSCSLFIEPPVLIPRSETERWVYDLIDDLKKLPSQPLTILDLCTGSGAIACALAKELPFAHITATDISLKALELTKKNADYNVVTIKAVQSDLFQALQGQQFDLIVTNPPYISHEEWTMLDKGVSVWEDYKALVAPEKGLGIIKRIIQEAPTYLKDTKELSRAAIGQLYCEIGYNQGAQVAALMQEQFCTVQILKDYAGHDRVVSGHGVKKYS